MKGVVFNLLETVVTENYGADTWDDLLDSAHSDGVYTSLETYDDDDLFDIVTAASKALGLPQNNVIRWFGKAAMPHFKKLYNGFFLDHDSSVPFLATLNDIIHPEVRKLYPGASVPDFTMDRVTPNSLELTYRSRKRLCSLAMGMIEGSAPLFGEVATVVETKCMHSGADCCVFDCSFTPEPEDGSLDE